VVSTSTRSTSSASIERIEFHGGDISVASLRGLKKALDGPAIFYLALPAGACSPTAAEKIAKAAWPARNAGYRRLVIEKPFGTDLETALQLNEKLPGRVVAEDQIFRIDHFLGKETVQNMLVFRFANRFIEPVLNSNHVDENPDHRRRDPRSRRPLALLRRHRRTARHVQNHLIQMLTFATMEPPALWTPRCSRPQKVEGAEVDPSVDPKPTRWGQYTAGLVDGEPRSGTAPNRASIHFAHRHVRGGPAARRHVAVGRRARVVALGQASRREGARVGVPVPEPPNRLFRHTPLEHAEPNWLVFRMSPSEATELVVRTKQPASSSSARVRCCGPTMRSERPRSERDVSLLLDCVGGDHTPFLRFDEVEWSWRIVDRY